MSPAAIETRQVTVAGVRSPVLCAGPSQDEEAVVFVHGNPGPAADWRDLLEQVGGFARAIAPDMPGYGAADKPREFAYTVAGYAQHLAGVLSALGIGRAHLVMHDFGGPWGLAWAAEHPEAFASATLINTGVLIDYRWHYLARIWRTPVLGELFMATSNRPASRVLISRDNPRLPPAAVDKVYDALTPWATKRAVLRLYRATPASSMGALRDVLRPLDRPALALWSTEDAYLPWQQAERQRETFPSVQVQLLEGLGHWPFVEDPARVMELVLPFLREQVGGGPGQPTS